MSVPKTNLPSEFLKVVKLQQGAEPMSFDQIVPHGSEPLIAAQLDSENFLLHIRRPS